MSAVSAAAATTAAADTANAAIAFVHNFTGVAADVCWILSLVFPASLVSWTFLAVASSPASVAANSNNCCCYCPDSMKDDDTPFEAITTLV